MYGLKSEKEFDGHRMVVFGGYWDLQELEKFKEQCIYQGNKVVFIDKVTVKKRESMV